jgi:hypothetical protein
MYEKLVAETRKEIEGENLFISEYALLIYL